MKPPRGKPINGRCDVGDGVTGKDITQICARNRARTAGSTVTTGQYRGMKQAMTQYRGHKGQRVQWEPLPAPNVAQERENRTRELNKKYFVKQRVPLRTLHVSVDIRKGNEPQETVLSQVLNALKELVKLQSEAVGGSGKDCILVVRQTSRSQP